MPLGASRAGLMSVAVDDIPDSEAEHQWQYDDQDESEVTVRDTIATLDLGYSGLTWRSGEGAGGFYAELDGVDDEAVLSNDVFTHWVNSGEGTFLQWIKPTNDNERYHLVGTQFTNKRRNFNIEIDDDRIVMGAGTSSDTTDVFILNSDDTVSWHAGEWQAVMCSADGTTATGYVAQPPDYDVIEVESDSISNTDGGDYGEDDVVFHRDVNGDFPFDGGVDLAFMDSTGSSESRLQNFVDDSKSLYE